MCWGLLPQKWKEDAMETIVARCSLQEELTFQRGRNCPQSGQRKVRKADKGKEEPLPLPTIL